MFPGKRREDNLSLQLTVPFPGAERFSFTSSGENAAFGTCLMLLLWQLNFALIVETAKPREYVQSKRSSEGALLGAAGQLGNLPYRFPIQTTGNLTF